MGRDEQTNTNKQIRNKTNKQTNTHKRTPGSGTIEFQS
jgi:hypothetical protein